MSRFCAAASLIVWIATSVLACSVLPIASPSPTPIAFVSQNFPLRHLWTASSGNGALILPLRVKAGVIVSATYNGREASSSPYLYFGIDALSGKRLWSHPTEQGYRLGWWELGGGRLLLTGHGQIEAINLLTGETEWVARGYSIVESLDASEDTVYLISREEVAALDITTGLKKWTNSTLPKVVLRLRYDQKSKQIVVVMTRGPNAEIYLLDSSTGHVVAKIAADSDYFGCSDLSDDLQFYQGRIFCGGSVFDVLSSNLVMEQGATRGYYLSAPLLDVDTWYIVTPDGTVRAVDLHEMAIKWEYPTLLTTSPSIGPAVAVANGTVYAVADNASIRAIDQATGQEIGWLSVPGESASWGGAVDLAPVTSIASDGTRIFINYGRHLIYAFGP